MRRSVNSKEAQAVHTVLEFYSIFRQATSCSSSSNILILILFKPFVALRIIITIYPRSRARVLPDSLLSRLIQIVPKMESSEDKQWVS